MGIDNIYFERHIQPYRKKAKDEHELLQRQGMLAATGGTKLEYDRCTQGVFSQGTATLPWTRE